MLTLEIDDELEFALRRLSEQEQLSPKQFIEKLLSQYSANQKDDFFSYAGLWEERDIDQQSLRDKAWRKS